MRASFRKISITAGGALLGALSIAPVTALSAPGTLADVPLFLTNPVEPNILFMVDDSGSMDWGLMTEEADGIMSLGCAYYYAQPAADNSYTWVVPTEAGLAAQGIAAPYGGVWRARNADYNRLYYNPTITYTPWPGEDGSGSLLVDANPRAVPLDPYVPSAGSVDVTARTTFSTDYCAGGLGSFNVTNFLPAQYWLWKDTDGDGAVDADDIHVQVEIDPATLLYVGGPGRRDCAAAPTCTYAEEIQQVLLASG